MSLKYLYVHKWGQFSFFCVLLSVQVENPLLLVVVVVFFGGELFVFVCLFVCLFVVGVCVCVCV